MICCIVRLRGELEAEDGPRQLPQRLWRAAAELFHAQLRLGAGHVQPFGVFGALRREDLFE